MSLARSWLTLLVAAITLVPTSIEANDGERPRPPGFKLSAAHIPKDLSEIDAEVRRHPFVRVGRPRTQIVQALEELEQRATITATTGPQWRALVEERAYVSGELEFAQGPTSDADVDNARAEHIRHLQDILHNEPAIPRNDAILLALGLALERAGAWEQARSTFGRLIREHPGTTWERRAYLGFAQHLWQTGQYALCERSYEQAAKGSAEDHTRAYVSYRLAWLAIVSGDQDGAWRHLQRANILLSKLSSSVPWRSALLAQVQRALEPGMQKPK